MSIWKRNTNQHRLQQETVVKVMKAESRTFAEHNETVCEHNKSIKTYQTKDAKSSHLQLISVISLINSDQDVANQMNKVGF